MMIGRKGAVHQQQQLLVLVTSFLFISPSSSKSLGFPHPLAPGQQLPSTTTITPSENKQLEEEAAHAAEGGGGRRVCSYTVKIKTSCSSVRSTSDAISLAFGDAYRNEVYAARLDDPSSGTFERCSTDTFEISGPCGYGVCYLYLRRSGRDGWTPEWVKVYERSSGTTSTYYYRTPLPNAVWYGFNRCPKVTATRTTTTATAAAHPSVI